MEEGKKKRREKAVEWQAGYIKQVAEYVYR